MHILIIPSWYKTYLNPVGGSFFEEQARVLQRLGHKVSIFSVNYSSFSSETETRLYKTLDFGLQTWIFNYKSIIPRFLSFNHLIFKYKANRYFKEYVKHNGKPDIIHAHSVFYGGFIAEYISQRSGIPFVVTEHLTSFHLGEVKSEYELNLAKRVFNSAKQLIVVSHTFKQELANALNIDSHKIEVINNVVANGFFNINAKEKPNRNELRFFSNSHMTSRKNVLNLIKAFELYLKKYPNARLVIGGGISRAGEEHYFESLKNYIANNTLQNNVLLLGMIGRDEVRNQLNYCDAFVLASLYETFGVVLIEALAAGKPILVTPCKGPEDIVNDKNGFFTKGFSINAIYEGLEQLTNALDSFDAKHIKEDCRNRFSEEVIVNQIINMYNRSY